MQASSLASILNVPCVYFLYKIQKMIKGRHADINNSPEINFMLSGFICMYHSMNHQNNKFSLF